MPVAIRMAAPIRQASAEVSPIDPGMSPRKACIQETLPSMASRPLSGAFDSGSPSYTAMSPSAVAPL